MRKLLSILLAIAMLLSPISVFAEKQDVVYTALGDSIAVGTGGTGNIGYVDMLKDKLEKKYTNVNFNDMSSNGLTSSMLLTALTYPLVQLDLTDPVGYQTYMAYSAIRNNIEAADVITISIGGNDILGPMIVKASQLGYVPTLAEIMVDSSLLSTLNDATTNFNWKFAQIMGAVRSLNDDAQIYVNTIYNPFRSNEPAYALTEAMLDVFNGSIVGYSGTGGYLVVDVHTLFAGHNANMKLVDETFNINDFSDGIETYLHPTDLGYRHMFNIVKDLIK